MTRYMTQYSGNKELWLSFLAAILITAVYAFVVFWTRAIPPAGALFGHLLGVLGFILMLLTETLYSIRKRSRTARWGSMASWLQFHIFTGLVGPYLVLLHTSWKFNGLAGATTLLTILIVLSGFIGRYIYTQIPRTLNGIEIETPSGQLQISALARARRLLAVWHIIHIPIGMALFTAAFIHIGAALYYSTLLR
jgi:xanthosine utilization system XapX-like protein